MKGKNMQKNIITEWTLRELAIIDYTKDLGYLPSDLEIHNRFAISRSIIPRNAQWLGWFIENDGTINVVT